MLRLSSRTQGPQRRGVGREWSGSHHCCFVQVGCTQTNSSTYAECPSAASTGRAEQLRGQEYTTMVPLRTTCTQAHAADSVSTHVVKHVGAALHAER